MPTFVRLTDTQLADVLHAVDTAPEPVSGALGVLFNFLLAPEGKSMADFDADHRFQPTAYAIPSAQWQAISARYMARGGTGLAAVNLALDYMNYGPSSYDDAEGGN